MTPDAPQPDAGERLRREAPDPGGPLPAAAAQYETEDLRPGGAPEAPDLARAPRVPESADERVDDAAGEDAEGRDEDQAEQHDPKAVQPVTEPLPDELQQALAPHMQQAVQATREALRQRFGSGLHDTMRAANRTLARFGSPALRAAFKANPVFGSPDVVAMFAAVDRALQQGRRPQRGKQAAQRSGEPTGTDRWRPGLEAAADQYDRQARRG